MQSKGAYGADASDLANVTISSAPPHTINDCDFFLVRHELVQLTSCERDFSFNINEFCFFFAGYFVLKRVFQPKQSLEIKNPN